MNCIQDTVFNSSLHKKLTSNFNLIKSISEINIINKDSEPNCLVITKGNFE